MYVRLNGRSDPADHSLLNDQVNAFILDSLVRKKY